MKTLEEIKEIVASLSLEEKASLCSGSTFWFTQDIPEKNIPHIMVSDGPVGLRKQDLNNPNGTFNDSIKAVCFPAGVGLAASFNKAYYRQMGEALGTECRAEKVSVILGPAVNIKRSPLCGRNFEYLSEDPYLAGEMSAAYIEGVQSKGVGTSIKHFALNSMETRRLSASSNVSERAMREIYLAAFEKPVKKSNPMTIMCSYNKINGELASENRKLLTDILRKEWGYDGIVVSDWGAVSNRVKALENGLNLEMPTSYGENDSRIVEAVQKGELSEEVLDQNVIKLLSFIFDGYEKTLSSDEFEFNKDAHNELSRRIAAETFVLLKNNDKILPLNRSQKIAVIGAYAEKPRFQGGGSAHINCSRITSFLDGCKANDVVDITFSKGFDGDKDIIDEALINEAVENAKNADVAVIFAGLPDIFESEGYDRKHMRLPDCQLKLIDEVCQVAKKTVIVLHNGSPIEMPFKDKVDAILECYLGGQAVGLAQCDVIFGKTSPSGKLAETFPLRLEDTPCFLNFPGDKDNVNYAEDVFVGYRYYDKRKMDVSFPFGYGLSYSEFRYSNLRLDKKEINAGDTVKVSVDVTNIGNVPAKEIVELYVKNAECSAPRPIRELKDFDKIYLTPGETKKVEFELNLRSFAYFNEDIMDWYIPEGTYGIEIGKSSRDIELSEDLFIKSTPILPDKYTYDSVVEDILGDYRVKDLFEKYYLSNNESDKKEVSDVEKESMNEEMQKAGFLYSPLRSSLYFSDGKIRYKDIDEWLDALNEAISK